MDYQGRFTGPEIDARLEKAESAYQKPPTGIPAGDLAEEIQQELQEADTAYQKPATGIPASDLEQGVQEDLDKANTAYQKPSTGIPATDLDADVQAELEKADTAYQKPETGIPETDLDADVQLKLQKAGTAYQKPLTGIPSTDLESGVIPDVSQFITRSVNDLANYYLKSETYTRQEVEALIAAISQFHYEVYATLSDVTNPANNVLYLIGPTGTGGDKYEEYVWPDAQTGFVKIGDTSIDLTGYVTTQALNTALANYTTTTDLNTLLAAKENTANKVQSISENSTNDDYPGAAAVYNAINPPVQNAQPAGGMLPNVVYDLGLLTGNVSFSLAAGVSGRPNVYLWTFETGSTIPTIEPMSGISWVGGDLNVVPNKHYEISIYKNVGVWMEV